jgi:diguanylate cyclase (GGDEF)-like protein
MNPQTIQTVESLIQKAPKECTWAQEASRTLALLVTQAANIIDDLRQERDTDGLTGIMNRRAFQERVEACMPQAQAGSLVLLDIDHFKQINDTLGHAAGDSVLKTVAKTLQETSRSLDIVARMGGEEFGVFLPGATLRQATLCANRLRKAVAQRVNATASFGVTSITTTDTWDTLYKRADALLYQAKNQGRNRVVAAN